jgi:hypothetical protein
VVPPPDVARDAHPTVELQPTPARRALRPTDDRQGFDQPRLPASGEPTRHTAAAEIAAREERIQLMSPIIRTLPGASHATATRAGAEGGVHIGSLEVHVMALPISAIPTAPPPPTPPAGPQGGRAAAPLARGFPAFGLVQS